MYIDYLAVSVLGGETLFFGSWLLRVSVCPGIKKSCGKRIMMQTSPTEHQRTFISASQRLLLARPCLRRDGGGS